MRKEIGTVVEIKNRKATISIARGIKCNGCKSCAFAGCGKNMLAVANDPIGVRIGERVVVSSRDINQVTDGFKLFIMPLALFIFSYFAFMAIFNNSVIGIIAGLLVGILPFVYFKLNRKKYQMVIESIFNKDSIH